MDAARGWKARSYRSRSLPEETLQADAADDAAVCDRATSGACAEAVPGRNDLVRPFPHAGPGDPARRAEVEKEWQAECDETKPRRGFNGRRGQRVDDQPDRDQNEQRRHD